VHRRDVVGAVDVWMCSLCKELFCEEKRWGVTEPQKELGFTSIEGDSKWAILVCKSEKGADWSLTTVSTGGTLNHKCPYSRGAVFKVTEDFKIITEGTASNEHDLYLIESYINRTIEF